MKWSTHRAGSSKIDAIRTASCSPKGDHALMLRFIFLVLCSVLAGCDALVERAPQTTVNGTLLDRATARPDPAFSFELVRTHDLGELATGYTLRLTSQTWRDESEVSHPVWTHNLQIVRPAEPDSTTALLVISGGSRTNESPSKIDDTLLQLAQATRSVCVLLPNVPNQPLAIIDHEDPSGEVGRREDDLIAQSWVRAIRTQDAGWVAQIAMVKSAIAAMDATQEFLAQQPEPLTIDGFLVTGASKRGWTTWLTGAVDDRVRGLMPIVIDTFDLPASIEHHWSAYGAWSPAIHDYTDRELFRPLGSKRGRVVRENVDPYLYRNRFTMPKFLLNSTGDQFFLPDSVQHYLDDLPGLTRLRFVPNTDHDLDFDGDEQPEGHQSAMESLVGFSEAVEHDRPLPSLHWLHAVGVNLSGSGPCRAQLSIRCDQQPKHVTLWEAFNPDTRDFRQSSIGNAWSATPLTPTRDHRAVGHVEIPGSGYRAYFIEARFDIPDQDMDVTFTTPVYITPDTMPFAGAPIR